MSGSVAGRQCDLSIIVVNWNTLAILRECLASVFANLGSLGAEVFVVDNASSDGSPDMVAREFPQAILIRNRENRGFAAANNQALARATGRYVLLLNSDTVVLGEALVRSVAYMDERQDVGVMTCRVLNMDGTLQRTSTQYPSLLNLALTASGLTNLPGAFFDRYHRRRWDRSDERDIDVVPGCFMLVRHEAIRRVGVLDEGFHFFGEDADWSKRFRDAGWKLRHAPVGEIKHHGAASISRLRPERDVMLAKALVRLHRKHGGRAAAAACWLIQYANHAGRAAFFALAAVLKGSPLLKARRDHAAAVARGMVRAR
jgi:hypothetical protein